MLSPAFSNTQNRTRPRTQRAFTLIELFTVVAIVIILVAITVPAISRARAAADDAQCRSALRYWGIAVNLYMGDNDGYLPGPLNVNVSPLSDPVATTHNHLGTKLAPYIMPNSTTRLRIPENYVCRRWGREKTSENAPIWHLSHTVPRQNAAGNVYPWGYASNPNNNKPHQWAGMSEQIDIHSARALRDIDKGFSPSASDGRPALPVHGTHRNVLYLDWHVGQEALN